MYKYCFAQLYEYYIYDDFCALMQIHLQRNWLGEYCFCAICHSVHRNFNLANNFWTVSARDLIFQMSIPCDKTFTLVPLFFTLWPWPKSLTQFLENFNLANNFLNSEVLELWYFKWVFLVTTVGTIIFYPMTLTLEFQLFFENFNLANNFWIVGAWSLIFHMNDPSDKPLFFYPVTLEFDLFFFYRHWSLLLNDKY